MIDDVRAIMEYDRAQAIESLYAETNEISNMTVQYLPKPMQQEVNASLLKVRQSAEVLEAAVSEATTALLSAAKYVETAAKVAVEMQSQRDKIADELADLVSQYDDIASAVSGHVMTEREDTRLQIVGAMGWHIKDAETFLILITHQDIYEAAYMTDWSPEDVLAFRQAISQMLLGVTA